MERDAVISHGIASFLLERMMYTSDAHAIHICGTCGLFAQRKRTPQASIRPHPNDVYWCPSCKNSTNISRVMMPYAFKLLLQELMSMSIAPRMHVRKDKYVE